MEKPEQPIKFKHNLQILRKRAGLSQEELAEKIDISRQSVSKWESGEAYPEMKTLLGLCDLFHIGLDELIHGDVEIKEDTPLRQKYEKFIRRHATLIPVGVGLILVGVTIMLALQGSLNLNGTEFEPLTVVPLLVLIAMAVVLFVITGNEKDDFRRRYRSLPNLYTADEVEASSSRQHYFIASGIGIIILGVATMMALLAINQPELPISDQATSLTTSQPSLLATATLLGFVSVGVPLILHGGIMKDSYDIKKYNHENSAKTRSEEERIGAASGVIMMLATIIYLITGFALDLWDTTWWVFPIGGILCGIFAILIKSRK